MVMPTVAGVVRVAVAVAAVSAALGLEGDLDHAKVRSEAVKHVLDHVVGPNTQNLAANVGRQMPISEMPRKPHELSGVMVPDFNN
jgi:hypothetical protein